MSKFAHVLFSALLPTLALAGPPLICRPFAIGEAPSLSWMGGERDQADPQYPLSRLVHDTVALLTPETPVLVRMETLRRATRYAYNDRAVAADLLRAVHARVHENDALSLFDAGMLTESFRQMRLPVDRDGYGLLVRALAQRKGDPEMEFAAALSQVDQNRSRSREHHARARAAARPGSLLAQNLERWAEMLG